MLLDLRSSRHKIPWFQSIKHSWVRDWMPWWLGAPSEWRICSGLTVCIWVQRLRTTQWRGVTMATGPRWQQVEAGILFCWNLAKISKNSTNKSKTYMPLDMMRIQWALIKVTGLLIGTLLGVKIPGSVSLPLKGENELEPRPQPSPQNEILVTFRIPFKISDDHPRHFYMGVRPILWLSDWASKVNKPSTYHVGIDRK